MLSSRSTLSSFNTKREDCPPISWATCLQKAINGQETAVKEKHVRSAIIGTYQERGASTFWECVLRLPLRENAIVCWKFCHVLHKVLREGHDNVLRDSQRFRPMLQEHGRFWSHLKTGYGGLIKIYCNLLHTKLNFHSRNNRIPGNLEMDDQQLIQCAGDSEDAFFQLSVEMFDYLDGILDLQNEIFKTMDSSKCNSMTNKFKRPFDENNEVPKMPSYSNFAATYVHYSEQKPPPDYKKGCIVCGRPERPFRHGLCNGCIFCKVRNHSEAQLTCDGIWQQLDNCPVDYRLDICVKYRCFKIHQLVPKFYTANNFKPPKRLAITQRGEYGFVMDLSKDNVNALKAGQCRLKPLIPCIQDSMLLYDYVTKILFRLHARLPDSDLLVGHRERFHKVFRGLQQFYEKTMRMQYFKNLIDIQLLPANPPNFLVQSDLENYETRKVTVLAERDVAEDKSDTMSDLVDLADLNGSSSPDPSLMALVLEKERIIEELRGEIERLKSEFATLQMEARNQIRQLQFEKQELASELQDKNGLLVGLKRRVDELEQHECKGPPEQIERLDRAEKHIKVVEEKFGKMKDVYAGLREEHIDLLRKKAAVDKELVDIKKAVESHSEMGKLLETVKQEKNELEAELLLNTEQLNTKTVLCEKLDQSVVQLKAQVEELGGEKASLEVDLQQKLTLLKSQIKTVESTKEDMEQGLRKELEVKTNQLKSLEEAKENLKQSNDTLTAQMTDLSGRIEKIANELSQSTDTNDSFRQQIQGLQLQMSDNQKSMEKEALRRYSELLDVCINQSDGVVRKTIEDLENPMLTGGTGSLDHFIIFCRAIIQDSVQALKNTTCKGLSNFESIKEMLEQLPIFIHSNSSLMVHGSATSRASADIQKGDEMLSDCRNLGNTLLELLDCFRKRRPNNDLEVAYQGLNEKLNKLLETARSMGSSLTSEADAAEVLDKELQAMELAIEEASKKMAEILSKSRASHTGVKLEVNEKLIDSCTALMNSIRLLVQKAKLLQSEIAAQGKGSASVKEFYKRNHQWTEGLISAAKSVGIGAKFLLESADKAVTNQGANFEYLIASSQEITSSTIQLVVASQVRADRSSSNLAQLKQASTGVKTATAHVIATAKDCAQLIEESDDMDVTKISPHLAKRMELETQAEVLRLQSELEKSRMKLAALRQHHYHNADG